MIKKWALRIGLFIFLILLSIFGYLVVNKKSIKEKIVTGINAVLDAKVEVSGAIDITFLSTFPKITLEFQEVFIQDKIIVNDTLAQMAKVNFSINPFSLFQDTITLNSIYLHNGIVHLHKYKDGKTNFNIIRKKENVDSNSSVSLNLENVLISNVDFSYSDDKSKTYFEASILNAGISGQFLDKDLALQVVLNAEKSNLNIAETQFLSSNEIMAKIEMDYENEGECFKFKENDLVIDGNKFKLDGNICVAKNTINILANAKGDDIEKALKLAPKDLFDLDGYKGNGAYFIEVSLKNKLIKPKIEIDFSLEDAEIVVKDFPHDLSEVYASGTFSNSPRNNLVLKDFDFKLNKSHLSGNVFFPNLKEKKMQLKASGEVFSEDIEALKLKSISFDNGGKIKLNDLNFDFSYRTKDSIWIASKLTGDIKFENIKGKLASLNEVFTCNANFDAQPKRIQVKNLDFTIGNNDLKFVGNLQNALNYFQDNLFKTNEPLVVNGVVSSNLFDINTFLNNKENTGEAEIPDLLKWLNISASVDMKIGKMKYRKLEITDLSAKIKSNKAGTFNIKNLSANGLNGNAKGNIELRFFKDKTLEVSLNSKLSKIDINKLFIAFDNFEQKTITNKNLKGFINANLIVAMSFKNFTEFETKDLLVQSNFSVQKGELIKLKSLQAMSKYLSVEQLSHIYFSEYNSELKIVDKIIYLQNNKIKSNVLSLNFGGSHSFNNQIDYAVKLNLTNILAAKFKKNKSLEEDYVNDIAGGINIFLTMKGDVNKPEIKMVKRKVFNKDKNQNKQTLIEKEDLKEYFKKNDPNTIEEKEFYFEDEEEFIDFAE